MQIIYRKKHKVNINFLVINVLNMNGVCAKLEGAQKTFV